MITNDVAQRPLITFFDSTFIMMAHGLVAFYVSVYLIGKYKTFNSTALFFEFVITVVIVSGICTVLAVAGIWKKDKPDNFINNRNSSGNTDGYESTGDVQCEADDDIHFRDYITILKHNKPIRMLVIAAASNKFASMVYSNSTVLVMFYGILMDNYALAGVIGMIVGMPESCNNICRNTLCTEGRAKKDYDCGDMACNHISDNAYAYDDFL